MAYKAFPKRKARGLQKEIKLSSGQLYYRLALENADFKEEEIDLDSYYKSAEPFIEQRDKALLWYAILLAALYFSYIGAVRDLRILGLSLNSEITSYFILPSISVLSLTYAMCVSRVSRYVDLFIYIFNKSTGPKKQDIILRYPKMFTSLHFNSWMTGAPRYMVNSKFLPKRIVLILILSIPAILFSISFFSWLIYRVSYIIWVDDPAHIGIWSKLIVAASISLILTSWFVPSISLLRIRFNHLGLLTLLGRFEKNNQVRYSHYVMVALETEKRMGLTSKRKGDAATDYAMPD